MDELAAGELRLAPLTRADAPGCRAVLPWWARSPSSQDSAS
jgi:hypothetical protein